MPWQKLVLLNYTLMCLADAPLGLVQPFACSDSRFALWVNKMIVDVVPSSPFNLRCLL